MKQFKIGQIFSYTDFSGLFGNFKIINIKKNQITVQWLEVKNSDHTYTVGQRLRREQRATYNALQMKIWLELNCIKQINNIDENIICRKQE